MACTLYGLSATDMRPKQMNEGGGWNIAPCLLLLTCRQLKDSTMASDALCHSDWVELDVRKSHFFPCGHRVILRKLFVLGQLPGLLFTEFSLYSFVIFPPLLCSFICFLLHVTLSVLVTANVFHPLGAQIFHWEKNGFVFSGSRLSVAARSCQPRSTSSFRNTWTSPSWWRATSLTYASTSWSLPVTRFASSSTMTALFAWARRSIMHPMRPTWYVSVVVL